MQQLATSGASPSVVADQRGRPTFTRELARATKHLLEARAAYGTYNVTNSGPVLSWAELAREVFRISGRDPDDVAAVTTEEYAAGQAVAPRPKNSALDLAKLESTGYRSEDAVTALRRYCSSSLSQRP
jgi:dTDP-4-dehydrorhamnose 3,5-epimerase